MVLSIIKWVFMRITQASERLVNSPAVPLPMPVLASKIPLPTGLPNQIQGVDIHILSTLRAGLLRRSNRFFLCRQGATDATPVSQRGPDDFVRAPPLVSGTRRFAARRSPRLGGGSVVGCRGSSVRAGRDGLARDDRAELVRSVDRTAADHAVRHALRDPRRARSSVSRA